MQTAIFEGGVFDLSITHNIFYNIGKDIINQGGNGFGNDILFWDLFSQNATNNLDSDPLFVGSEDYHLQAASPAIDAGNDEFAPEVDFEGVARLVGKSVDIGPYQFGGIPVKPLPTAATITLATNPTTLEADSASTATLTATVEDGDGKLFADATVTFRVTSGSGAVGATQNNGDGTYTVTYTAGNEAGNVQITAETDNGKTNTITLTLTEKVEPAPLVVVLDKTSLDFGNFEIGQSKPETLTITNPNDVDLVVASITANQTDFTIEPTSFTLQPGSNQLVTVTFKPSTEGSISGILTFTSNAEAKAIPVSGVGEQAEQTFGAVTEISFAAAAPTQMIAGGTFQFNLLGSDADGLTQPIDNGDTVWETQGGIGTVDDTGKLTVTTVGKGTVKVVLKANATIFTETGEITVIAAPTEKVQVSVLPDSLTAGSSETVTVTITVTDTFGNPVTGQTLTLTATDGIIPATATEIGNGVYNATYTAGATVGNAEIRATTSNSKVGTETVLLKEKLSEQSATFEISASETEVTVTAGEQTVRYRIRLAAVWRKDPINSSIKAVTMADSSGNGICLPDSSRNPSRSHGSVDFS